MQIWLDKLNKHFPLRYAVWLLCAVGALLSALAWVATGSGVVLTIVFTGLADKPWCSGIHLSLADIAVGCALGYLALRFPQIDWRDPHPNLAKLADKLNARQSFIDTLPPQS